MLNARLEEIVKELEGPDLSLEESLARYEEGSRLVRDCAQLLERAEQRIKTLTEGAGETVEAVEAEEDDREESDGDLPF